MPVIAARVALGFRMSRLSGVILIGLLCLGCGSSDPRLPISGSVQLDGQPLAAGTIEFSPVGPGGQAGGSITEGRFAILASRGLPPGNYLVRIMASGSGPATVPQGPPGPESMKKPAPAADEIPAKYNTASELTVTVAAGTDNSFEFLFER